VGTPCADEPAGEGPVTGRPVTGRDRPVTPDWPVTGARTRGLGEVDDVVTTRTGEIEMAQVAEDPSAARDPSVARWLRRTRESRLGTLAVLVVTGLVIWAGTYALNRPQAGTSESSGVTSVTLTGAQGAAPVVGRPAPDFRATTTDGKPISLASLKGHPVWLTFGASWCAACRTEAPDVEAAYEKAKASGAVVLEVFISEDSTAVQGYAARVGLTYPKVADPDTLIASQYRVLGIPAHFFVDSSGVLRAVKAGSLSPDRMDAALAEVSR
jgi:cytochrome c biogenesis protein CcmG/thiol:disulfide interchange protein DsbE